MRERSSFSLPRKCISVLVIYWLTIDTFNATRILAVRDPFLLLIFSRCHRPSSINWQYSDLKIYESYPPTCLDLDPWLSKLSFPRLRAENCETDCWAISRNGPHNMGTWTIVVHISVQTPPEKNKPTENDMKQEKYRQVSKSIKHIQTFSRFFFITFYNMLCRLWTNAMWLGLPMHLPRTQLPEFHPPESAMLAMAWCPFLGQTFPKINSELQIILG